MINSDPKGNRIFKFCPRKTRLSRQQIQSCPIGNKGDVAHFKLLFKGAERFSKMADEAATRMSRATRALGETYTLLLLLTWNDIVTNGGKQSVHQIEQSIKVRAIDWVRELFERYTYIPIKDASSVSLTNQIEKDTGVQMVRKAKEAVAFIVNVLNPAWKDPDPSGTQIEDALIVCRQAAWQRNEEEKKKQA